MAERKLGKKATQKPARRTTASGKTLKGFTDEERAAMKERAQELKAEARRGPRAGKADDGMPAYAKDGKVVCFFQDAAKFKARYATLGFSDTADLDEGAMWPTAFALTKVTAADEARIGALVKKAVS